MPHLAARQSSQNNIDHKALLDQHLAFWVREHSAHISYRKDSIYFSLIDHNTENRNRGRVTPLQSASGRQRAIERIDRGR
jgi:hypothetical protein